jgi:hypothetical protein
MREMASFLLCFICFLDPSFFLVDGLVDLALVLGQLTEFGSDLVLLTWIEFVEFSSLDFLEYFGINVFAEAVDFILELVS